MEDLKIDLELEDIKRMTKTKFKEYVNEQVRGPTFLYLMNKKISRNSDRAKGKYLEYNELDMAKYLTPMDYEISIDKNKWLFQCRIKDVDLYTNRKWNNEIDICMNCPQQIMDQRHPLECK